ncbi:MAG: cohesin domain-containing protein [bacterium]|jgi:hypothetical protein|nr:cohesin domain-containing protein [bacterium]
MRTYQRLLPCLPVLFLLASAAWGQALVRLVLPPCAEPAGTVWLDVRVELEPGQTFKSYDIRIPFDPAQVTLQRNQIQQGSWFTAGGPTFFWHDIIGNELYVNGAILGPGLHVTGSGVVFRLPVLLAVPGVVDLQATTHLLFDVNAQLLPSFSIPAALQAPCTSFNLRIHYEEEGQQVLLEWDPQGWTQSYRVYGRDSWSLPWQLLGGTVATNWPEPLPGLRRFYQVRAQFVGQ